MSAGRPMQFDPEEALECAMQVFWRRGCEGTSLQDLLRATRLSKSSLYQTFGNKHALFERCMQRYRLTMVAEMREMLSRSTSGRAFIESMLLGVAKETTGANARRGCLVMNTATEFAQSDPDVADLVRQGRRAFVEVFEAALLQARREGDLRADADVDVLARYLVSSLAGLKTMVKAGADAAEVTAIARVSLALLE